MKKYKTLFIAAFVLIASISLLYWTSNNEEMVVVDDINKTLETAQTAEIEEVISKKLIIGNPEAEVTVTEYIDYKCPNCNKFHRQTFKEIQDQYIDGGTVNFEIRPLPILGPDSPRTAQAAYCANDQQKFVEFNDKLLDYIWNNFYRDGDFSEEFEDVVSIDVLKTLSEELEIDSEAFITCIEDGKFNKQLENNIELARDDEANGTPGFVIGEQSFVGSQPFSVFETLIELQLKKEA